MFGGGQVFKGAWERLAASAWTIGGMLRHNLLIILLILPFE